MRIVTSAIVRARRVACFALLLCVVGAFAAKAPLSEKELMSQADLIVVGDVKHVRSVTQKSNNETGFGYHRDRVFTITLEISTVVKGNRGQEGKSIKFEAWQPRYRVPPVPGLQGHGSIPARGDRLTCYLIKNKAGVLEPLLPNGLALLGQGGVGDDASK